MTAGFISSHHDGNMPPNDHRTGTRLVQLVVQLVDSQIDLLASLQQREPLSWAIFRSSDLWLSEKEMF